MQPYPTADLLAPFRAAVQTASAKMDAATSYPAYRLAQGDYNEAVGTLREAEYRLNPAAYEAHQDWRDSCASAAYHSTASR